MAKRTELKDVLSEHVVLDLVEGKGEQSGKVFVRGEFGNATKPTANGRLYPEKLWENQFGRLKENLKARKVLGELDHPQDGRTALTRASHVITDLKLEDGVVVGEAEILDTAKGKDLKAILSAGVPVGISSRGYGSTKPDAKGNEVVQEDYKLVTFDFVAEPADDTAYPEVFFEGVEFPMDKEKEKQLAAKFAKTVVAPPKEGEPEKDEESREEATAELLSKVGELRTEIEAEVRAELLADPSVAGAKTALEGVLAALKPFAVSGDAAVAEKDAEISNLKNQIASLELQVAEKNEAVEKLSGALKEAGYKFFMERLIDADADAESIREAVGDVTQFESIEALSEAVEDIKAQIEDKRTARRQEQERVAAERGALEAKQRALAEGLEEALLSNRQLALQLYAERRLAGHPEGEKIRAVLDHTTLESKEQIDDLLEQFREVARDPDDLAAVRDRVRNALGGGRESLPEGRTRTVRGAGGNYNGLGTSLRELRSLSGLGDR